MRFVVFFKTRAPPSWFGALFGAWLKPDIPNSDIIPDYFSVYRKDRPGGERGGGVLIAVNNNLLSSVCTELDTECEILWVKIELTTAKDFHFGVFYRPPTTRHNLDELQRSIEKIRNKNSIICLYGDFNLPNIS